ncbi:MAG: GGDEF domain-containing protein [Firmicutes bacterium]|nr:GGDEF domain-containing protein [Bacillota bacterium]
MSYYSSICILTWVTLGVLCVLVSENDRLSSRDKRILYISYALIALSAFAEWMGLRLDGREGMPSWPLRLAKTTDYILTPLAGGAFIFQLRLRDRINRLLAGLLGFNAVFQIIAAFTGWMVVIDKQNHYTHGPFYTVYVAIYLLVILLMIVESVLYGKKFRKQNRASLYAIMFLVLVGVALQELTPVCRTAYIAMSIGAALIFIHSSEFAQLSADDHINEQQSLIDTDALTGVGSRFAYEAALREYETAGKLPEGLFVFMIDINGLKKVNDTLGHDAGDELIKGAAECVGQVFEEKGRVFRTGGDEFVVLAEMTVDEADEALSMLKEASDEWKGEKVEELGFAIGCVNASAKPWLSVDQLVREADMAMYAAKDEYYRTHNIQRRII